MIKVKHDFQLNDYELRKGKRIGVTISFNNHRLFVGNIPKNKDRDELLEELRKHARKQLDRLYIKFCNVIYYRSSAICVKERLLVMRGRMAAYNSISLNLSSVCVCSSHFLWHLHHTLWYCQTIVTSNEVNNKPYY